MKPGTDVVVFDRFRFAIPVQGVVVRDIPTSESSEVQLSTTNNPNNPVGSNIVVFDAQLMPTDVVKSATDHYNVDDIISSHDEQPGSNAEQARESVQYESYRLCYPGGDRHEAYGPPVQAFEHHAKIFNAIAPRWVPNLRAIDIAYVMLAVKLSRERNKHKRDNLVDAVSYLDFIDMIFEDDED